MKEEQPNYYAIIPANVRYADIPAQAKLLYGEITALCNQKGYCWASNQYFADLYNLHKVSISRLISILEKNNFITIHTETERGGLTKRFMGLNKNVNTPLNKNVNHNNTSINNKNNKDFFEKKQKQPYFMNKPMTKDLKQVIFGQNDLRTFAGKKEDIEWK
ncbi:MAG: helix-turn-helix domain-containing protein [Minisyncoccia bacterium]